MTNAAWAVLAAITQLQDEVGRLAQTAAQTTHQAELRALRREKDDLRVRPSAAQRFRNGDAGIQMATRAATGEENRFRFRHEYECSGA